jgi:tetratricopeptide (TPR) repeat protein
MAKKHKPTTPPSKPAKAPVSVHVDNSPAWLVNTRLHMALLFLLGAMLYANTFNHEYALDDAIVITDNMFTAKGLSGVPGILKYDTFYGFFKEEGKATLVAGGRYRPLSLVTFAMEYQLFGKNPMVGHIANSLWYGLTVVVLYLLLMQLFGNSQKEKPRAFFIALTASALFAAHPLHTEVVANIKGRDEILALLGSLGALYFSMRAFHEKKTWMHVFVGFIFLLGLLSKENAITFVAVAPLTFYYFTKAKPSQIAMQTLPFAAAALVFLLIRNPIVPMTSIGDTSMELMNNPFLKIEGNQYVPFTAAERLATVFYTLGKYLVLLFIPHPLTHDYYPRHIGMMSWGDWQSLLSLAAYLVLGIFALLGLRRKDPVSYGVWFYLLTLSIVSNLVFSVGTHMAERLLFMPSVGFCIALSAGAWQLLAKNGKKADAWRPAFIALAVVVGLFSLKTILRNPVWKNNYTLFTSDVQISPNSAKLRNAAAGELITTYEKLPQEEKEGSKDMLTEAVGHLNEALKIHPNYKNAYLLMGNAYIYLNRYEEAVATYQKALELDPDYSEAQGNIAVAYREAGKYQGEKLNNLPKALEYLEKAYQLKPDDYETVRLLGVASGMAGNHTLALELFTKGTQMQPENAGAWLNLGFAYYNSNNKAEGDKYVAKAESMQPGISKQGAQPQQQQ